MKNFYFTLFLAFIISFQAFSQTTIYVNSSTGNDATGNGTSGNPYKTFHKGYTMASSGNTLDLTGTFTWTDADETGDVVTDGYSISKNITIQGQGAGQTIIQAAATQNTADRRVFTINNYDITIKKLTIRYGYIYTEFQNYGAGILIYGTDKNVSIEDCNIEYNDYVSWGGPTQWKGGGAIGIYRTNSAASTIAFNRCNIQYNNCNVQGSIIWSYRGTTGGCKIKISDCTINNNVSTSSCGIYAYYTYYEITNTTITANTSGTDIINAVWDGYLYLTNNTIAYNSVANGYYALNCLGNSSSYYYLKNNILAQNKRVDNSQGDYYRSGGNFTNNGYNLVEVQSGSDFTNGVNGCIVGVQANLNLSNTLASNNSNYITPTLALQTGSVAINAGASGTNGVVNVPTQDQRGFDRVSYTDMGAFESDVPCAVAPLVGDGSALSPYEIANFSNLLWVSQNSSSWDKHFVQTADVDMSYTSNANFNSGAGWSPIGNTTTHFMGTYDGQGYLITDIYINRPATDYVGLFGAMVGTSSSNKAILREIKIEGVDITGNKRVGALLGKVNDNHHTLIEYCYAVDGTVKGTGTTGGLVGANNGTLTGPPASNQTLLRYCFADIDVSYIGTTTGEIKIGGLVGCGQRGTIMNCYALGNVNGTNGAYNADRVGGLAGCIIQGSITNSYALGSVTASGDYIGALTGRGAGLGATDGVFNAFYNAANWQSGFNTLGTSKNATELKTASTFTSVGWDFDNIWAIDAGKNNGYPYLLVNPPSGTTPVEPDIKAFNVASGDWATASNWEPNGVPTATTYVTLPADAELTISDGTSAHVLDMEISPNATLTINSGASLTVHGNIYIEADENGSGSFIDNGTFTLNGQAFVQKYLASSNAYGWTVSSPIVQSDSNVFNGSLGAYFYNPLVADWRQNDSTKLKNMLGYWTKFSANKTLEFNHGTLNTGSIQYTNFYRTAYLSGNFGWNFIGNPYPSAIDWDLVVGLAANGGTYEDFEGATKLNSGIYISNNNGGYSSFNDGEGNPPAFDGIIPPATAFWIQVNMNYIDASDPISGAQLTLNNTARVHENAGSKKSSSTKLRMIIDNGSYTDESLLRLKQATGLCFDPSTDTYKMLAENEDLPQIYMLCDNEKLSINAISDEITTGVSIPLGIISYVNVQHVLSFDLSMFDNNVNVYLEDIHNNITTDIRQQNTYNYQPLGTEENDRFILHLTAANAAINTNQSESATSVYSYDGSLYINLVEADAVLSIYNVLGQEVYNNNIINGLTKLNLKLVTGTYMVNVFSNDRVKRVKLFVE